MLKYILYILVITFLIYSCGSEEEPLEIHTPDSFTYQIDDGWELNVSVRVKGIHQKEKEDSYSYKVSYNADLYLPDSSLINEIDFGIVSEEISEEVFDAEIESQIVLDSTFAIGQYKIIFKVKDENSGKLDTLEVPFELTLE